MICLRVYVRVAPKLPCSKFCIQIAFFVFAKRKVAASPSFVVALASVSVDTYCTLDILSSVLYIDIPYRAVSSVKLSTWH